MAARGAAKERVMFRLSRSQADLVMQAVREKEQAPTTAKYEAKRLRAALNDMEKDLSNRIVSFIEQEIEVDLSRVGTDA